MSQLQDFNFRRGQSIRVIFSLERLTIDSLPYDATTNPYIPVDLTGSTAAMEWRTTASSPVVVLLASTSNSKLTITDPTSGEINLILVPSDTANLRFKDESVEYGYDLEITDLAGDKTYPFYGTITIDKDYTRV